MQGDVKGNLPGGQSTQYENNSLCDRVHMRMQPSGSTSFNRAGSCCCKPDLALTGVMMDGKQRHTCSRALASTEMLCSKDLRRLPLPKAGAAARSPSEPCPSTIPHRRPRRAPLPDQTVAVEQQGRAGTDLRAGPIKDALCDGLLRQVPWEGCWQQVTAWLAPGACPHASQHRL